MSDDLGRLDVAWAHGGLGHALREAARVVLAAVMAGYVRRRVEGRAHLDGLAGPVVFVANHNSHMDTPAILHALPRRWRRRTVVGAAADYFYRDRLRATIVSVLFNTVPVARRGTPDAIAHLDALLAAGHSLLLYPEGTRSRTGRIGPLRPGAARLAARHGAPLVPIHVSGTRSAMPPGRRWPRRRREGRRSVRHDVTVTLGPPIASPAGEPRTVSEQVERFFEHCVTARR